MDKNSVIGISLIGIIMFAYMWMQQPSQAEKEAAMKRRDSIENVIKQKELAKAKLEAEQKANAMNAPVFGQADSTISDSAKAEKLKTFYGSFAKLASGENEFVTLENNLIKLKVSTLGGRPYSVELKEYTSYDSAQVVLFDGNENVFGFNFSAENRLIKTNELFFVPTSSESTITVDESTGKKSLNLRLSVDEDSFIEYTYSLAPDQYMIDFDVHFKGMNDIIAQNNDFLELKWQSTAFQQEKGRQWEEQNSSVFFKAVGGDVDYLSMRKDNEVQKEASFVDWIAFKQHFFTSALIAKNQMGEPEMEYTKLQGKDLMKFKLDASIDFKGGADETIPFQFYFGPNHYKTLVQYENDLQKVIPLGDFFLLRWVNRFVVIPVFNFLGSFIANYGLVILLLTIFIKAVLFPLTFKSYQSTAKMKVLKPQIEEINKKFPKQEDAMKKQQATMSLYKKAGVNPLGGCLPMLVQMPILIAMFRFFPASIELRHKSFLWATDLSTYDSIIDLPFTIPFYGDHVSLFCLLMAASMILTTKMSNAQMDTSSSQMPGMKSMMYIMPVMMLFWFNSYSAGLSYYYFVSNIITFIQMRVARSFIDEEAVLKQLQENAKKPVKKSGFQARLEKMAKEQQAKQQRK